MRIGFICGAFDLLHAGHIHLFKEAKKYCDQLIVGLHVDPSIERKHKNKPIESLLERGIQLRSCKYVDQIIPYEMEADLELIFKYWNIDIRFLGTDYIDGDKSITSPDSVEILYIQSLPIHTSDIRERIKKA